MDKNTLIFDVLKQKPEAKDILHSFGMHCLGCPAARGETLAQAAAAHNIDIDELLAALNQSKG